MRYAKILRLSRILNQRSNPFREFDESPKEKESKLFELREEEGYSQRLLIRQTDFSAAQTDGTKNLWVKLIWWKSLDFCTFKEREISSLNNVTEERYNWMCVHYKFVHVEMNACAVITDCFYKINITLDWIGKTLKF